MIENLYKFVGLFYRYYFRCQIEGLENIPGDKNVLIVTNHSGLIPWEIPLFFYAWKKHFGKSRPLYGLAHQIAFEWPMIKSILPKCGAIPANPENAKAALISGKDLIVYPGGEKECLRPFWEHKKVQFYNRQGFLRVASETKSPIVTMTTKNSHLTYIILNRGKFIADLLGFPKKYRIHFLPITLGALAFFGFGILKILGSTLDGFPNISTWWLIASLFCAALPWPRKIKFQIHKPFEVSPETELQYYYQQTTDLIQSELR